MYLLLHIVAEIQYHKLAESVCTILRLHAISLFLEIPSCRMLESTCLSVSIICSSSEAWAKILVGYNEIDVGREGFFQLEDSPNGKLSPHICPDNFMLNAVYGVSQRPPHHKSGSSREACGGR